MTDLAPRNPSDRSFDLSLRLLTTLVVIALTGSVSLLAYRFIAPRLSRGDSGPVTAQPNPPMPPPAESATGPAKGDEVLMDPGRVFRCEDQGRVSFSDHACTSSTAATRPPASGPH
jgi:hypothetical protein